MNLSKVSLRYFTLFVATFLIFSTLNQLRGYSEAIAFSNLHIHTTENEQSTAQAIDSTNELKELQDVLRQAVLGTKKEKEALLSIEQGDADILAGAYGSAIKSYEEALGLVKKSVIRSLKRRDGGNPLLQLIPLRIFIFQIGSGPAREVESFNIDDTDLSLEEDLFEVGVAYFKLAIFSKMHNFSEQSDSSFNEAEVISNEIIARTGVFEKELEEGLRGDGPLVIRTDTIETSSANLRINSLGLESRVFNLLQQIYVSQGKKRDALLAAESGRTIEIDKNIAFNLFKIEEGEERTERLRRAVRTLSRRLNNTDIERIKGIAAEENSTLISYSIVDNPSTYQNNSEQQSRTQSERLSQDLYIWVIQPTGEIHFKEVELNTSLNSFSSDIERLNFQDCEEDSEDCRGRQSKRLAQAIRGTRESLGVDERFSTQGNRQTIRNSSEENLEQLYEILIGSIEDLLPQSPGSNLIFVPQGSIFFVPFPALKDGSGNYLIDKYVIRTATNFRTLLLNYQNQRRQSSLENALIVGNPTIPEVQLSNGVTTETLLPLEGAEQEAKRIGRLFPSDKKYVLSRGLASETIVTERMARADVIHFATHGLLDVILDSSNSLSPDNNDDDLSLASGALVLAASPPYTDGLLTAAEILRIPLNNTELVVLSGCNTGRGPLTTGGVIGLPFAFSLAGVPNTVVSLWSVADDSTEKLMTEFYNQLLTKQSNNEAEALRQAMLNIKANEQYSDPVYWAAFTLIGLGN
ncbi:CHAT domain-containing protein [Leptothoe sp. LEGE 181152]|nr:CHAT domain-containing protein [Leptothoe sp. LEGE 181152]